jgi:hypothetical protein
MQVRDLQARGKTDSQLALGLFSELAPALGYAEKALITAGSSHLRSQTHR